MKRSLHTQMLLQYVAIVIICMIVIPASISKLLDRQFRRFAEEKLVEDQQEIVLFMQQIYSRGDSWNSVLLYELKGDFLRWPIIRAVLFDADGVVVREFRRQMKRGMDGMRGSPRWHNDDGTAKELVFRDEPIIVRGQKVGTMRFICLPFNDSREGGFLREFNRHMAYAVAFMIVIAVIIAFFMAERISRPVLNVAKRASAISEGHYKIADKMSSDITEIQTLIDSIDRLGLALEAQEELRKRLISDMAHELRNPVTIIKSHLEAFEDGVWEPTAERVKLTVDEIDRLSGLITEVETLMSVESADGCISLLPANLSEELENIALVFDPLFANKSVSLIRDIQPDVCVNVDMAKMRRVIENLLSNALRYTDSGGKASISLKRLERVVEISVADTGIGIPEKDIPYIFERFYRTDESRARKSGGMGIGLAIVKAIVEAHGGNIRVDSKVGAGSIFTVTIPLYSAD